MKIKKDLKKILTLVIIFLFFGSAILPIINAQSIKTNDSNSKNINGGEDKNRFVFDYSDREEFVPRQIIIKFKDDLKIAPKVINRQVSIGINSIDVLNEIHKVDSVEEVSKLQNSILSNVYLCTFSEDLDVLSIVNDYEEDPSVEYAEPNYIYYNCSIPNDPDFSKQWALNQPTDCDMDAPESWDVTSGDSSSIIAMIDSGVDYNHPDLADNIWINTDEIPDNDIDDDGNGYVDDVRGWDFYSDDNDPMDTYGHGTHCSGIASAVTDNGIGMAGVSWSCSIMAIKAGDEGGLSISAIANGIEYATDNGADVISMSFGGSKSSNLIEEVLTDAYSKGVIPIAAAGNGYTDEKHYPSSYNMVISVAATDKYDEKADFSNYGKWVDVAAPGLNIYSTLPDNKYAVYSGTSMACPHVSGLAALIRSKNPDYSPLVVRDKIVYSCDRINTGYNIGYGRVNSYEALIRGPGPAISEITSPNHLNDVEGTIDIIGSASGEEFQYYIIEYCKGKIPDEAIWTEIINSTNEIENDVLCSIDTTLYDEGAYNFRLKVICESGMYRDRICLIVNNNHIPIIVDDDLDADYHFIQDAVNNAGNNDIINVRNGTYFENIRIKKSITLNGEDKNSTIIDGSRIDNVVFIFADNVKINGFTIQNCVQEREKAGVYLKSANYNEIYDNNIIKNFYIGEDNYNHHICGVFIDWYSGNNKIYDNNVSQCEEGIVLYGSRPGNIISGNIISNITVWCIFFYVTDKNKIIGNTIYCNESETHNTGIDFFEGNENLICGNTIIGGWWGYGIDLRSSHRNTVIYNNITNFQVDEDGWAGGTGLDIYGRGNKIIKNNFINNERHADFTGNFNRWRGNYWDNWIGLEKPLLRIFPKAIKGETVRLFRYPPRLNFDWRPAKEPYDIKQINLDKYVKELSINDI